MSNLTFELPLTRIIALVEQWLADPSSVGYAALLANRDIAHTECSRARSEAMKEVTQHAFLAADLAECSAHANLMSSSDYAAKFAKSAEQYVADFHKLLKEAKNAEIQ